MKCKHKQIGYSLMFDTFCCVECWEPVAEELVANLGLRHARVH
jgi:hypothetical protein